MKHPWPSIIIMTGVALAMLGAVVFAERARLLPLLFIPTPSNVSEGARSPIDTPTTPFVAESKPTVTDERAPISTVASGLDTPWEIAFLPDGDMLVTERPGRLRRYGATESSITVPEAAERGEGGQMGLALHPDFAQNGWLYLSYTSARGRGFINQVVRHTLRNDTLTERAVIIDAIPAGTYHDGGRIAFGPDGTLYVTTGDAQTPELAQDTASLAGKILRVNDDGTIPVDNPFGNAVWSYGHRNPQGIAWDDRGRLWSTEHGRSGALSGFDELNLIEKGKNYGWPDSQGDTVLPGTTGPVRHSGASDTWAPAGIAFWDGSLFFAGLRGSSLYEANISADGDTSALTAHLRNDYGRLRAVTVGPDGELYVGTSNKDGRGSPKEGDDRILRVERGFFRE